MTHTSEIATILFDYWETVPSIKIINTEIEEKVLKQDFRESIIELLTLGVNEKNPNTKESEIRHVFSAKEIMSHLEQKFRMSIKYPGLYFHLSKLEENEIIKEVTQIKIKKNNVSYYGLTARNFVNKRQLQEIRTIWIDKEGYQKEITSRLMAISSTITEEEIEGVILELKELNKDIPEGFDEWVRGLEKTAELSMSVLLFLLDLYRYKNLDTSHFSNIFGKLEK